MVRYIPRSLLLQVFPPYAALRLCFYFSAYRCLNGLKSAIGDTASQVACKLQLWTKKSRKSKGHHISFYCLSDYKQPQSVEFQGIHKRLEYLGTYAVAVSPLRWSMVSYSRRLPNVEAVKKQLRDSFFFHFNTTGTTP